MEHVHSEFVAGDPDKVFGFLRDPASLTQFVPQLTKVDQRGEHVEVEARYEGRTQHGEAAFHVDEDAHRVEWGTDSGYSGWLQVEPDGDGSMLTLGLHCGGFEAAANEFGFAAESWSRNWSPTRQK